MRRNSLGIGDSTANKILKAARILFVKNGYAATSIAKIATLAEINHSLIFHHFGNKQKLWVAVKQDIVDEAQTKKTAIPSIELELIDFIRQFFHNIVQFYHDNPDIVQMINWQRIEYEKWQEVGISSTKGFQEWAEPFKLLQIQGKINTEINPAHIVIYIFSLANTVSLDPIAYLQDSAHYQAYVDFCIHNICTILYPS